jgi:glycosyltransferase involved in cell wall biosynthesis
MFVSLLTRGSPDQLTGGYLYHRRVAALAEGSGDRIDFLAVRRLASPYAEASGDVILVDSIAAAAVAPWGSPAQPLAAIIHQPPGGIDASRPLRVVQAALDRSLYRRCELLIAASEALGQELAAAPNKLPVDRIVVVPPGCDLTPSRSMPVSDLRRGRSVALVSVGNWIPRKGTLDLLAAFSRLAQDRATLHLAGRDDIDHSYARRARARITAPDLVDRVEYHGPLAPDQIASLYAGADAFVLPSYREPYGTVYGEALAAGLPVIGWRAGNLPNLIHDGVEGVLVPAGDVVALAQGLERLATDPSWRCRLRAAAAQRGARLPTWADTTAGVLGSLRELVHGAR